MVYWLLASALLGALGDKKAADAEAAALEYNRKVAEIQARDAIARGEIDVNRLRLDLRQLIGSQRVSAAVQGIAIDSGSALQAQTDSLYMADLDVQTIRNNAAREAWGYQVEGYNFGQKAAQVKSAANFKIAGSLLGAAGKQFGGLSVPKTTATTSPTGAGAIGSGGSQYNSDYYGGKH